MRGLKCQRLVPCCHLCPVAPYTGAWIEIQALYLVFPVTLVAPYTGAWIEISSRINLSPPIRVAPYTGAWIEIANLWKKPQIYHRRTLHGCVD